MAFWEHVYELRRKGLIPREWKWAHLERYLEKPQGPFQRTTIMTVPYNLSLEKDGRAGNFVRKGQLPKAWRLGEGVFQLIVDPDDDEKVQDRELVQARHLVQSGRPGHESSSVKIKSLVPTRPSRMTIKVPRGESEWDFADRQTVDVLDRLTKVKTALGQYDYLQRSLSACDVVTNRKYRTAFNHYYRMRQRRPRWYEVFFSILEREKHSDTVSFRIILEEILRKTGRLEASFGSKLIATINANLPVWDQHVLDNLGLKAPSRSRDTEWRLNCCVELYASIQAWSSRVIQQDEFWEWRRLFDGAFPRFRHFTDIKKLDLFLWQSR